MTKTTNEKGFDCIEYKRQVQREIYEKIKDMTPEEEIEFFRNAAETGPFAGLVRAMRARQEGRNADQSVARSIPIRREQLGVEGDD